MNRRIAFVLGWIACNLLILTVASAQDSAHVRAVRVQTDSLRKETCRGGTLSASGLICSGAKQTTRVTTIRRLANRVDSIEAKLPPLGRDTITVHVHDTITINVRDTVFVQPPLVVPDATQVGYAVQLYYESGVQYFPAAGTDTVTICATVTNATGVRKLAWPPIQIIRTIGDSAVFELRNGPFYTMANKCANTLAALVSTDTTSVPVAWSAEWITYQGRRLWRPFPTVPE